MDLVISSAHGLKVRGAKGFLDEVDESRRVVDRVAHLLRGAGVGVNVFHDNTSTTVSANLNAIVNHHNSRKRDRCASIHFNAFQPNTIGPRGTECLHKSQQAWATRVAAAMARAGGFINRGAKQRSDLRFLNSTQKPAVLLEVCFVDSQEDARLYRANFEAICRGIAESLADIKLPGPTPEPPTTTVPPPSAQRPTLRQGSRGDDVRVLQRLLNTFPTALARLNEDGNFGPLTDNRVREFQRANVDSEGRQLTVDGVVGPRSWSALEPAVTSRNIVDLAIEPKGHEHVLVNGVQINETTGHSHERVEITATHLGDAILNINGEDFQVEPPDATT